MAALKRFILVLDRMLDNLGALSFMGMMLVLCLQIVFRYFLQSPIVWATPMAMFLFVWGIWFGGAAGVRDENQIRIEFSEQFLPVSIKRILLPLITLASAAFLVLVIAKSARIIELQSTAVYDTLPFNRDVLFIVVPIVGSIIVLQCVRVFVRQVRQYYFPDALEQRQG